MLLCVPIVPSLRAGHRTCGQDRAKGLRSGHGLKDRARHTEVGPKVRTRHGTEPEVGQGGGGPKSRAWRRDRGQSSAGQEPERRACRQGREQDRQSTAWGQRRTDQGLRSEGRTAHRTYGQGKTGLRAGQGTRPESGHGKGPEGRVGQGTEPEGGAGQRAGGQGKAGHKSKKRHERKRQD